jgi:hypothetical protein
MTDRTQESANQTSEFGSGENRRTVMMTTRVIGPLALLAATLLMAEQAAAKRCKADAVQVGSVCMDKYEASVWEIPASNVKLIKDLHKAKITSAADLTGAMQHGSTGDDYGAGCPDSGNGCVDFYAVSIAGVTPSASLTWFQAAAACRNAGKRLPTNQEWQMAALGTPDPGTDDATSDCNTITAGARVATGSRSLCVSDTGAFDMVGNVREWVADWGDAATNPCTSWGPTMGNDFSCIGGDGSINFPGAWFRGGDFGFGAGVFTVDARFTPLSSGSNAGFRCVREP